MKRDALPFSVNRNDARSLVDQVADGLRQAIVTGHWRVGDEIPSTRELVPLLGVSHIVTRAALSRLAAEGYVLSRHGLHPVVRDRAAKQWRGHVALVCPEGDDNYLQTILAGALRNRLLEEGYLFSQVSVRRGSDGKHDFSQLEAALSRSVDLVVALYDFMETFRFLAARKVPFAALRQTPKRPAGAVGFTHLAYNHAARDFAAECVRFGVREVVEVLWGDNMCDVSAACAEVGVKVSRRRVRVDVAKGRLDAVRRAGMEFFAKMAETLKTAKRPGGQRNGRAFFIADDYLASGALLALAEAGLKAPRDMRVATWANAGLAPAYPRELSRMELDPVAAGETVAAAALEYLSTGQYPEGTVVGPKWVKGETMGGPA